MFMSEVSHTNNHPHSSSSLLKEELHIHPPAHSRVTMVKENKIKKIVACTSSNNWKERD